LIEAGLIEVSEQDLSRGGRPGDLLKVVGDASAAVGLKIAESRVVGTVVNLDAKVLRTFTHDVDMRQGNPLQVLVDLLRPHVEQAAESHYLLGIGVGLPGSDDPGHPGLVTSPLLHWYSLPIGDHLTRALGLPVLVDNDVNTLAVAESLYGIGERYDSFLTLTLGRGVGLSVVVAGEVVRGSHGVAGEIGHLTIDPAGPLCDCGRRGCLETFTSDGALVDRANARGSRRYRTPADLLSAADEGDQIAREVYREAGGLLGRVLAQITVVLDPAAILLSGEGSGAWHHMEEPFRASLLAGRLPVVRDAITVVQDPWDDTKWALGAAALVLQAAYGTSLGATGPVDAIKERLEASVRPDSLSPRNTTDPRR
jgi:predicted NBD/HSP70 family sugar kinase